MSESELIDELLRLDAEVATLAERRSSARRVADEASWKTHVDAVADLKAYGDDVAFKRREPDVDEQRRLTEELLGVITDRGLLLEEVRTGLRVVDPRPARELEDATRQANEARRARTQFERANREAIEAERARAGMDRVRSALDGDDPAALRAALADTG